MTGNVQLYLPKASRSSRRMAAPLSAFASEVKEALGLCQSPPLVHWTFNVRSLPRSRPAV